MRLQEKLFSFGGQGFKKGFCEQSKIKQKHLPCRKKVTYFVTWDATNQQSALIKINEHYSLNTLTKNV